MHPRKPVIVGIVGDSAAGKTTLTRGLATLLGTEHVSLLCTDDYHRYDRVTRTALGITPLHPACNDLERLERDLERLARGQAVLKPVYDHGTGTFADPEYLQPREIVVVEGLLGYATARMRRLYDLKIYLDPPEDLRWCWKLARDTTRRGYTADQVLHERTRREPDSRDFIRPQRAYADVVVQFHPPRGAPYQRAALDVRILLRPPRRYPLLDPLRRTGRCARAGLRLAADLDAGRPVEVLEIHTTVLPAYAAAFEQSLRHRAPGLLTLLTEHALPAAEPLRLTRLLLAAEIDAFRSWPRTPLAERQREHVPG